MAFSPPPLLSSRGDPVHAAQEGDGGAPERAAARGSTGAQTGTAEGLLLDLKCTSSLLHVAVWLRWGLKVC